MIPRKLSANFAETDVDDETLLIDLEGGLLFSLKGTGQAVWRAIDGAASSVDIARMLAGSYRGEADQIAADIRRLLEEFAAAALVELGR